MNRKLPFYHLYAVVDKRTGGPLLVGISNHTSDANKFSQAFTAGGLQGLDPADHELRYAPFDPPAPTTRAEAEGRLLVVIRHLRAQGHALSGQRGRLPRCVQAASPEVRGQLPAHLLAGDDLPSLKAALAALVAHRPLPKELAGWLATPPPRLPVFTKRFPVKRPRANLDTVNDYLLYVIRWRETGEAVYCGLTANAPARLAAHVCSGALADKDPDDFEFIVVHGRRCTLREAMADEVALTEALVAAGEPIGNRYFGSAPSENFLRTPFQVIDVVAPDGRVLMCAVCRHGADYTPLLRRLFRHAERLRPFAGLRDRCTVRVVADNLTRADADALVVERTDSVGQTDPDASELIHPRWTKVYDGTDQLAKNARQAMTRCACTEVFIRCTTTGDLFHNACDAAAWAGCPSPGLYRALREPSRTAGGLRWARVHRADLTADELAAVHEPPAVRAYRGLAPEHVDPALRLPGRGDAHPDAWVVDGEAFPGDTTHWADGRFACTVVDLDTGLCTVSLATSVGKAWWNSAHVAGHRHTVHAETTTLDAHGVHVLRQTLIERGIRLTNRPRGTAGLSADGLGALEERVQRSRLAKSTTAVRCVETGTLFVNTTAPAVVHGLSSSAVSVAIAKGLTAAGLHWAHVLKVDLTPAQLDFLDRAAAAHLAGEDRAFYADVLGDVLTGPYIAKYRRAGLTDADLHELASHVADADQARRLANGELPMSTKCTFTCTECGRTFTTRPLNFWRGVRRCRGCVTRGNVHRGRVVRCH